MLNVTTVAPVIPTSSWITSIASRLGQKYFGRRGPKLRLEHECLDRHVETVAEPPPPRITIDAWVSTADRDPRAKTKRPSPAFGPEFTKPSKLPQHLPHDKMMEVFEQYRATPGGNREAMQLLVETNLRLVYEQAKRKVNPFNDLPDLFQAGIPGLIRAIQKFEPARKLRFSTYAVWWIRSVLDRYVKEGSALIRRPHKWEPTAFIELTHPGRCRKIIDDKVQNQEDPDRSARELRELKIQSDMVFDAPVNAMIQRRAIDAVMIDLEPTRRLVVECLHLKGMSGPETAAHLASIGHVNEDGKPLSRQRIQQLELEALEYMRRDEDLRKLHEDD